MSAWPSSICTARRSAPWLSRCVANAWRSVCGDSGATMPARSAWRLDELPEHLPRHRPAAAGDEERVAGLAAQERRARLGEIALQPRQRLLAERHQPLLGALAGDAQRAFDEAHVHRLQADQLADAQPARVDQLEHGAVAQAERPLDVGRGEQRLDLRLAERLRHAQRLPRARRACRVGSASSRRSRTAQRKKRLKTVRRRFVLVAALPACRAIA